MSEYVTIMSISTPRAAPRRLLDMQRAKDFLGDETSVAAMMPMLLESLHTDVPAILARLQAGDVTGANQLLHPLKGFVPVFCVDYVIDRVTEVEVFSKTASAAEVLPRYEALMPLLERLRDEIGTRLQG